MDEYKKLTKEAFISVYQKKWKAQGLSQAAFVKRVQEEDSALGIDKTSLSKMLNRNHQWTPSARYLSVFAKVLGVELEELYPSTENKYRYLSDYQDKVAEWNDRVANDCFGLNLSFLFGLKQLIDFDSEFPFYSKLVCTETEPENGYPFGLKYERAELPAASKGEKGKSLFQIETGGKVITLSPVDMKYLKAMQNYIIRKVREQFAHHRQELIDCMNEANEQYKDNPQPDKWILQGKDPLSPEMLQKVDRWGIYTEEENNKYRIPEPPEDTPITSAYIDTGYEGKVGRDPLPQDELRAFIENKRRKKGGGAGEAVPDGAEQSGGGQVPDHEGQGAAVTELGGRQKKKGGSNNGKAWER